MHVQRTGIFLSVMNKTTNTRCIRQCLDVAKPFPIMQMKQQEKNPLLLSTRSNGRGKKKKVLCGNNAFKRTFTQLSGFFFIICQRSRCHSNHGRFLGTYVVISSEKKDPFRIVLPLALESLFGREMGFWYLVAPFWFYFLFIIETLSEKFLHFVFFIQITFSLYYPL